MTMYKNKGFSLMGALLGVAVGIAIVATAGAGLVATSAVPGALGAVPASVHVGTAAFVKGAIIGGVAGGILGGSGSKSGSGAGGTGAGGTEGAGAGAESGAAGAEAPVDCSAVQQEYTALQQKYEEVQKGLQQAQQNLSAAAQGITSSSNNYNVVDEACYSGQPVAAPCGQSNKGGCDDLQHQCNNMQALIDSTTQATCQIQTNALKVLPGGTASTTANPSANVFTLGITPNTVNVGGTISVVTTISVSNIAANRLQTFSISVLDQNGTTLGLLTSNIGISSTLSQVSMQYNFQLPTTLTAGTYTVKIFNDAKPSENTTAKLTITGAGGTNLLSQNNSGVFGNLTLSPSTIYPGGSFLLTATVNGASVQNYSVAALKNGQNLGNLGANIPVGTSVRPTTVQQTFTTNSAIPIGVYSIQISDDANPTQSQATNLTIASASSFGPSVFTGTAGAAGTYINANGTSNVATGGVPTSGIGNICTLGFNLSSGSRDASTGGQVSALQNYLASKGMYSHQVTGYFGAITKAAVKAFQTANNLPSTGLVGPMTRGVIQLAPPCKNI